MEKEDEDKEEESSARSDTSVSHVLGCSKNIRFP